MAPVAMKRCGQSVTARLKKYAAPVPTETRVFMLADRWRSSLTKAAWKGQPTQNCTGVVSASSTQGFLRSSGAHGNIPGMLPSSTGTESATPTRRRSRRRRSSCARSTRSRSAVSGVAAISSGTV